MSITRKIRKIVHVFCEGTTEKNYFMALARNENVKKNYALKKPNATQNDLKNAIKKSKNLEGIDVKVVYVYDSDSYKSGKKEIGREIKAKKEEIYFSDENFEDFLKRHRTKNPYKRGKKPSFTLEFLREIEEMSKEEAGKNFKEYKNKKYKGFKNAYDLIDELFEGRL